MWPLVVLLLLGSASRGSAQLLFHAVKSVEYTNCNETVVIPCFVSNGGALSVREVFVKWIFQGNTIYYFDGDKNESGATRRQFKGAYIVPDALLRGIASLKMKKKAAIPGNYTCEVTELSREGETYIELKYHVESWFPSKEIMPILVLPMLAVLLFWGSGIVSLKYNASITKVTTILSFVAGLVLTILVIVGAILFVPGEYSPEKTNGLAIIVVATMILMLLQCSLFMIAPPTEMTIFRIILLLIQMLGFVLCVVGLSFCISECSTKHGPILISGLGIIVVAALLGLIYMMSSGWIKNAGGGVLSRIFGVRRNYVVNRNYGVSRNYNEAPVSKLEKQETSQKNIPEKSTKDIVNRNYGGSRNYSEAPVTKLEKQETSQKNIPEKSTKDKLRRTLTIKGKK